jgi:hypothetical protein
MYLVPDKSPNCMNNGKDSGVFQVKLKKDIA